MRGNNEIYQEILIDNIFALDENINKRELRKLEFIDSLDTETYGVLSFIFKPSFRLYLNLDKKMGFIYFNGCNLSYIDKDSHFVVASKSYVMNEFLQKNALYNKEQIIDIVKENNLLIKGSKDRDLYDWRSEAYFSNVEKYIRFDEVDESYIKIDVVNYTLLDELESANYVQYFTFENYAFIDIKDEINKSIEDLQKEIERLKSLVPNLVY